MKNKSKPTYPDYIFKENNYIDNEKKYFRKITINYSIDKEFNLYIKKYNNNNEYNLYKVSFVKDINKFIYDIHKI